MKLIQNNPFRVVGVLANASEREIQKNKSKIKAYSKIGKTIDFDLDFPVLDKINRNENQIHQALSDLEQNQSKLNHSIFWFLKTTPFDETAMAYLIQGNVEKALFIWDKITSNKEVTLKNYSSFNNLGTLQLLSSTKNQIKRGIETKLKLLEAPAFNNFAQLVVDETHLINNEDQIRLFIDQTLQEVSEVFSNEEALDLFDNCKGIAKEYLSKKLINEHTQSIDNLIAKTKRKRKEKVAESYDNGVLLYSEANPYLLKIKSSLGANNLQFKLLADNLAKEIMQCGIDYFQYWNETKDPSSQSIRILKYAQSIAVSNPVKDRIKDNIEGIEEWKETALIEDDLVFIAQKLEAFQSQRDSIDSANRLIRACKPKLQNIKNIIGKSNDLYMQLSSGVANNALGMLIDVVNKAQKDLEYDRSKILNLPNIVESALAVTETVGTLDMESQMRRRYNENLSAIRSLSRQLEQVRTHQQRQVTTRTNNDDNEINWLKLIGWGIGIFFFLRACNG